MNFKKLKIILISALGLIALLVTVGNGCSQRGQFETSMSSLSSTTTSSSTPSGGGSTSDPDYIPGAKTASVVYAKQALDQLTSCSGVVSPSDDTIRMYEAKKSSISAYGDAASVTAPMMMAIANISGEICDDLLDQEIASGNNARIFVGWNLAGTSLPQGSLVNDAITRMALSCWQKQDSSVERDMVIQLLNQIPSGTGATRKQALLLCTSMLSSLNSLLN